MTIKIIATIANSNKSNHKLETITNKVISQFNSAGIPIAAYTQTQSNSWDYPSTNNRLMNHSLTTTISPSFSLKKITQVPEPLAHLQQQSVLNNVTKLQRLLRASRSIKPGKLSQITLIL